MRRTSFTFGAAYYPDYIEEGALGRHPDGRLAAMDFTTRLMSDLARMAKNGITEIRVGEFSWSTVEPEPGSYHPQAFLALLDAAAQHDIKVIVATPTATPPKWLVDRLPSMLPRDRQGRVHAWGSRRHYDPTNPDFREHAARITEYYAKTFGTHIAVSVWQVDNELGHHGTYECRSESATLAFRAWLRKIYAEDITALNRAWFSAFWSQRYRTFDEIEIPVFSFAGTGPHIEVAYKQFCTEVYREFQAHQIAILRRASPGRPVTTNLISNFYDLCPWQLTADLDVVGFDHYQDDPLPTPVRSASNFTLMRSLHGKKFKVLEQQPVQVNWQPINRRFGFDWLWLWAVQSAAFGADSMHYFSWQRFAGGPEQFHDGVLPNDVRNPRSNQEKILEASQRLFTALDEHFGFVPFPEVEAQALIIHNTQSLWTHLHPCQSTAYDARIEIDRVTKLCTCLGLGFAYAPQIPSAADLASYRLVVLPGYAFELKDCERTALAEFIHAGGTVISLPRTAMKTKDNQQSPLPGSIVDHHSYYFEEYGALGPEEEEHITCLDQQHKLKGVLWAEKLKQLSGSQYQSLARFDGGLYHSADAILSRQLGQGRHIHLAFCPVIDQAMVQWFQSLRVLPHPVVLDPGLDVQAIPLHQGTKHYLLLLNFAPISRPIKLQTSVKRGKAFSLDSEFTLHSQDASTSLLPARSVTIYEVGGVS